MPVSFWFNTKSCKSPIKSILVNSKASSKLNLPILHLDSPYLVTSQCSMITCLSLFLSIIPEMNWIIYNKFKLHYSKFSILTAFLLITFIKAVRQPITLPGSWDTASITAHEVSRNITFICEIIPRQELAFCKSGKIK